MSIFEKLFGTGPEKKFPEETDDGTIRIEGNKIICKGNYGISDCEVNLDELQYAYVMIHADGQAYLYLFDYSQNFLPLTYKGFKETYQALSERFGFNDRIFFEHLHQKEFLKKEIWRRKRAQTYEILEEGDDYAEGFEIQAPEKIFISWDTTYEQIKSTPHLISKVNRYDEVFSFKYPVRVGKLLLKNFNFYSTRNRTDVAVHYFSSECYHRSSTVKSYRELKAQLEKDFPVEAHLPGYERTDQNAWAFDAKGIHIRLVYTFDDKWFFDGGHTSLSIENKREYPELLINEAYENEMEISNFLLLNEKTESPSEYKRDERIKRRPPQLGFDHTPVIWTDNKNEKIGFADRSFCQVFEKEEIESFSIQNILPAKGPGAAYLQIHFKNKNRTDIFEGDCYAFDPYKEKLEALCTKEVNFAPASYDV